jgi:hypothetical protein
MATVFKIKDIPEPLWTVEFPDGSTKDFDPWLLQQSIHESEGKIGTEFYDAIRVAFGLPAEADAASTGAFTLTRNQCLATTQALGDYIEGLPVSKKASSLSQK